MSADHDDDGTATSNTGEAPKVRIPLNRAGRRAMVAMQRKRKTRGPSYTPPKKKRRK